MGKVLIKEETLVAISDAIRAKTGKTDLMKPSQWTVEFDNAGGSSSGQYLWSKKESADGDIIGYAVADDSSKYPDGGLGADGYYWELVGGKAELMNFTIVHGYYDDIPLKAEKGMTWQEFVNSDYSSNIYINDDASWGEYTFSLSNNYVTVYDGDEKSYVTLDYSTKATKVLANDAIIENYEYYCIAGA